MLIGEMFDNLIVGVDDYDAGRDAVGLATRLASGKRRLTFAYVEVVAFKPPIQGTPLRVPSAAFHCVVLAHVDP